mmetsp:Transcript_68334/g.199925  ORF Transcript_68334/g.199925 Transcript_68334/m.199925 type:complete len:115 (-) Transcript_68334:458-802(-)
MSAYQRLHAADGILPSTHGAGLRHPLVVQLKNPPLRRVQLDLGFSVLALQCSNLRHHVIILAVELQNLVIKGGNKPSVFCSTGLCLSQTATGSHLRTPLRLQICNGMLLNLQLD